MYTILVTYKVSNTEPVQQSDFCPLYAAEARVVREVGLGPALLVRLLAWPQRRVDQLYALHAKEQSAEEFASWCQFMAVTSQYVADEG